VKQRRSNEREIRLGRRRVALSNLDKVLFLDYYRAVAPRILPHLRGRPVAIERYPDGIGGERIFQRHVPRSFPSWIRRVRVRKKGGSLQHVMCDDAASLVYLANQASVTPHPWLSRVDDLSTPDRLVFDLDPPADGFAGARAAARHLRVLLDELGLPSLVMTTGGKGLHVMVPLRRDEHFDEVRALARSVAEVLAARHPGLTTEQRISARRGRLFIDVMRNAYAQTAVPPYAVRARPAAPVAAPLDWSEVEDSRLRPERFTIRTMPDRLDRDGDPWRRAGGHGRSLTRARHSLDSLVEDLSPAGPTARRRTAGW